MDDFKVFFERFFQLQTFKPALGISRGGNFVGKFNSQKKTIQGEPQIAVSTSFFNLDKSRS
jgi:hypothetical protein